MPPKTRISKEMIIKAAFDITRELGIDNVSVRSVSKKLDCSTQPVMYCFKSIDELLYEVYKYTKNFHNKYLMISEASKITMLDVGMAYVRFASTEKNLFRLLFQSNRFFEQTLDDVVEDESIKPLINNLADLYNLDHKKARDAFIIRFLTVHGMASMLANNSMVYDEETAKTLLKQQFDKNNIL